MAFYHGTLLRQIKTVVQTLSTHIKATVQVTCGQIPVDIRMGPSLYKPVSVLTSRNCSNSNTVCDFSATQCHGRYLQTGSMTDTTRILQT